MNRVRIVLLAAILAAGLSLCSCSVQKEAQNVLSFVQSQIDLIKSEYDSITEFFTYNYNGGKELFSTDKVASVIPERENIPSLEFLPHAEIVESPYNSYPSTVVYSKGNGDENRAVEAVSDVQKRGYVEVPRFGNRDIHSMEEILNSLGLKYTVIKRKNPAPAGEVFAIEFAGISDSNAYYVNPAVELTVYVSEEKIAKLSNEVYNTVFFTYDDGPSAENTKKILDVLDKYGIKAAFFTTGQGVRKNPQLARTVVERGHILGCHSVTHDYEKIYSSTEALVAEVEEWEQIVKEAGIELEDKFFRFPGGSVGTYLTADKSEHMQETLEAKGYIVFDWNVVTNDALLFMSEEDENVYDYIKRNFIETFELCLRENAKHGSGPIIILMHETVPETVNLMPWMIEYLISRGYSFGTLDNFEDSWTFSDR